MSALQYDDHESHAERLHGRAEECRMLAAIVGDERMEASYLRLADAYETLAAEEGRTQSPIATNARAA